MKALHSFEMPGSVNLATRNNITEDQNPQSGIYICSVCQLILLVTQNLIALFRNVTFVLYAEALELNLHFVLYLSQIFLILSCSGQVCEAVMLYTCICGMPSSNLGHDTASPL
jgi:hypothetical protein